MLYRLSHQGSLPANAGDRGSIPGSGRSPGGGHSNPLQYSCLENPHRQKSLLGYSPYGRKESIKYECIFPEIGERYCINQSYFGSHPYLLCYKGLNLSLLSTDWLCLAVTFQMISQSPFFQSNSLLAVDWLVSCKFLSWYIQKCFVILYDV